MKKYTLLLLILIFISCKGKSIYSDTVRRTDSLNTAYIIALEKDNKYKDSIKNALIKSTFIAGYRAGVSTGINHCNETIKNLEVMAVIDSFKFANFVDKSFPLK